MNVPSQQVFHSVYRGRQSRLRHLAYMRLSKVFLLRNVLEWWNVRLEGKDIFDYGFGAGTFFHYCPKTARLFGVELDSVAVEEVSALLRTQGWPNVDLDSIDLSKWKEHRLLKRKYDLIVCSHVLEHLENPEEFLSLIGRCLRSNGLFVGLVPINERVLEAHHVQRIDRRTVESWVVGAGLKLDAWWEEDPWLYWLQPMFTSESGWRHRAAQAISLLVGLAAAVCGRRVWRLMGAAFQKSTASKSTQAALVLSCAAATDDID